MIAEADNAIGILRPLFPGHSDDDLAELLAYAEETWRLLHAIRSDPQRYQQFQALTARPGSPNG